MKPLLFIAIGCIAPIQLLSQQISGKELLQRSISYHDPYNNWNTFRSSFMVTMETPDKGNRVSEITIDLPAEAFYLKTTRDTTSTAYLLKGQRCTTSVKDSTDMKRTPCETATLYKNYYTFLYGLPMKLKDPGTIVHDKVELKNFKGTEYLRLKVTYDQAVGSDIWFFYFNPITYALEMYQFFKDDPDGAGKSTGEYILLSGTETIDSIKMPKHRAWYYNKNDEYLGTDHLMKN